MMKEKYDTLAKLIIENVGGTSNIHKLTHCMTRLRFVVNDVSLVQFDLLKALDGVAGVIHSNGQVQVIIGLHVIKVYDEINNIIEPNENRRLKIKPIKQTPIQQFTSIMTDIFVPFFGAIAACGILSGILSILVSIHVLDSNGSTYHILYSIANGFFYYMPILLAYSASKRFSLPVIEGLVIGAGLMHPNLLSSSTVIHDSLFSIGIMMPPSGDYSNSAIPIIIAIAFASWFEKKYAKYIPEMIKQFAVPLITCIVTFVFTLFVIGPIANNLTYSLSFVLNQLENLNIFIYSGFLGAIWIFVLMTGLHFAILPIIMNNFAVLGYDTTLSSTFGLNFVCIGILLAIRLKTKNKDLQKKCFPSIISAAFGVVEPGLYGVITNSKKTFYLTSLVNCIIGIGMAISGVCAYRFAGFGIFGYASYTDTTGISNSNLLWAFVWSLIAVVLGFLFTYFVYDEKGLKEDKE